MYYHSVFLEIQACILVDPERPRKVAGSLFWPFSPPSFSIKCVQKTGFLQWNEMLLPRVLWLTWDLIYRKPGLLLSSLCKDHKYSRKRTKMATLLCYYYYCKGGATQNFTSTFHSWHLSQLMNDKKVNKLSVVHPAENAWIVSPFVSIIIK